jgi:hypothetical protein
VNAFAQSAYKRIPAARFQVVSALMLLGTATAVALAQPAEASGGSMTLRMAAVARAPVCNCTPSGGQTPRDRELFVAGIGARWRLAGDSVGPQLLYAAELLPLIISRGTGDETLQTRRCGKDQYCGESREGYPWGTTSIGAGVLPLGLALRAPIVGHRLSVSARLSGGAVLMTKPVPVMESRRFNYLAEVGMAAEVRVTTRSTISLGITHNHISNAGTAPVNLGMDTRLLEVGLITRR